MLAVQSTNTIDITNITRVESTSSTAKSIALIPVPALACTTSMIHICKFISNIRIPSVTYTADVTKTALAADTASAIDISAALPLNMQLTPLPLLALHLLQMVLAFLALLE